jgi:multidrug/hemolysin transport system ATP-binding protein
VYFKDEEKDKILKMLKKEKLNYKEYKEFFEIEVSNISVAKDLIINYTDLFNDFEVIKGKMDNVFLNVTGKEIKEVI